MRSWPAALIDRLVHHCHIVTIRGNSYRMQQHTEVWHAVHTTQDPDPYSSRRRRGRQEVDNRRLVPRQTVRFSTRGSVRFWSGVDVGIENSGQGRHWRLLRSIVAPLPRPSA